VSSSDLKTILDQVVARGRAAAETIDTDPEVAGRVAQLQADARDREVTKLRQLRELEWERAGLPRRLFPMLHAFRAGGEAAPMPTPALEAVGRFTDPSDRATILVLAGGVGTGKTVAAALFCSSAYSRMVKAVDLVRIGLFSDGVDRKVLAQLADADLAVIDDVGAEPQDTKGYAYAAFFDAIERRYDAGAKTILTTNLTYDDFRSRYGTGVGLRFWDRIRGDARWVDIAGRSMRERVA